MQTPSQIQTQTPAPTGFETIKNFMSKMDHAPVTELYLLEQLISMACSDFSCPPATACNLLSLHTMMLGIYNDLVTRRTTNPTGAATKAMMKNAFCNINQYTTVEIDPPLIDHEKQTPDVRAVQADTLIVHSYFSAMLPKRAREYCTSSTGAAVLGGFVNGGKHLTPDSYRAMIEWVYSRAWADVVEEVRAKGLIPLAVMTVFVNSGGLDYPVLLDGVARKLEPLIYR